MAFTAAGLAQLEEMYETGVIESETADGKRVKFASEADLWRRIQKVKRALNGKRAKVGVFSPQID